MNDGTRNRNISLDTLAVQGGVRHERGEGIAPPIHLTSTFVSPGDPQLDPYGYGRAGSPGNEPLERVLADLEGGHEAVVFNAGIAAALAVLDEAPSGGAVVMPFDAYYGIRARAVEGLPQRGVEVRLVDQTNLDAVESALDGASLFWTETPTNPLLSVADLDALGDLARQASVPWFCDSTFATPVFQRPLEFGAAGVMHSVTKYLAGHSDLILGAVIVHDAELSSRLRGLRNNLGTQPDGFSCWLARRGVQTLPVRVRHQASSAMELANRLARHSAVRTVYYPGLPSHPGHKIAARQMHGGFGGMLSFLVEGGREAAERVVERCEVWVPATSLGGVESLIERRARWAGETADPALLRLSVGLEDPEDLWRDLEQALRT
jgi:cystathionine gamma-synthase